MPTTPSNPSDPELVERMVKKSAKASKVPVKVQDLATSHVVAQHLVGAAVNEPTKKPPKPAKGKRQPKRRKEE